METDAIKNMSFEWQTVKDQVVRLVGVTSYEIH